MKKVLFYVMEKEKMCFMHVLMNALDLKKEGHEVKIIFEGASVQLPQVFEEEKNPLYEKAKNEKIIEGACKACSKMMGVFEINEKLGLKLLDDMNDHAGMKPFIEKNFEVIVF
ncbi:MAG: hypothetical protein Q4P28_00715 [Tissierellia bacterium]|nr:hypothetical protein [Tissierellia bacterium]